MKEKKKLLQEENNVNGREVLCKEEAFILKPEKQKEISQRKVRLWMCYQRHQHM